MVYIKNIKDIDLQTLPKNEKIQFKCECGHYRIAYLKAINNKTIEMCRSCRIKDTRIKNNSNEKLKKTCEEKYGKDFQKNAFKRNMQNKYGVDNAGQLKDHKEKVLNTINNIGYEKYYSNKKIKSDLTKIKKYGSIENYENSQVEKRKKTCLEKYNVENPQQLKNIREKTLFTIKNKYNNGINIKNISQTVYWNTKVQQSSLKKYNTSWPCKSENIKKLNSEKNKQNANKRLIKAKETCLQKYGVEYYAQTEESNYLHKKQFLYENTYFDSLPELAFWIWCKDNGKNIKKCAKKFSYTFNNKLYVYFPDFEIDNILYEIKGDQFVKKDGTWQNPFDHSQDAKYEAKHQCALQNNVIILYKKDYSKFLDYLNKKYTKNFILECTLKNNYR